MITQEMIQAARTLRLHPLKDPYRPNYHYVVPTGGPGTGKTTTIAPVLLDLLHAAPAAFQFAVSAPTGKAASRLHAASPARHWAAAGCRPLQVQRRQSAAARPFDHR